MQAAPKLDKESNNSMKAYLLDPRSESADADGNTAIHTMVMHEDAHQVVEAAAAKVPHQLFMLNKNG